MDLRCAHKIEIFPSRVFEELKNDAGIDVIEELKFQRILINCVEAAGGYGEKLSHKTMIGMIDLLLVIPTLPMMVVEVKVFDRPKRTTTPIKIETTPLQKKMIRDVRAAGGKAGWLLATDWPQRRHGYCILTGYDERPSISIEEFDTYAIRGTKAAFENYPTLNILFSEILK